MPKATAEWDTAPLGVLSALCALRRRCRKGAEAPPQSAYFSILHNARNRYSDLYEKIHMLLGVRAGLRALLRGARGDRIAVGEERIRGEIEKVSEKLSRLTVPKDSIPRDAKTVFVSIDLARGCRGEEGYIALPRGRDSRLRLPRPQGPYTDLWKCPSSGRKLRAAHFGRKCAECATRRNSC